jgi:PAS domain S-box-containing protein
LDIDIAVIIALAYNLSLLVALSVVSGFIQQRMYNNTWFSKLCQGVLFGSTAIVGMLSPLEMGDRLFFDGRSVVISLSTLFFGPLTGGIAYLMSTAARLVIGGSGVLPGLLTILTSFLIGLVFYLLRRRGTHHISTRRLYLFGIVVHIVMLLMLFFLPMERAIVVLQNVGLPVMITYPLATVLIGKILMDQQTQARFNKKLSESEAKYRALIHNIPGAIYRCEVNSPWRVFHVTEKIFETTGYATDDYIQGRMDFLSIIAGEERERVIEGVRIAVESHQPFRMEYAITTADGQTRWLLDNAQCVYDEKDRPLYLDGLFFDITEKMLDRIALQANENLLRNTIDSSTDLFYLKDDQLRIISCNREFGRTLGKKPADLIGRTDVENGWDSVSIITNEQDDRAALAGETIRRPNESIRIDSELLYFDTVKQPLRDDEGRVIGVLCLSRNITERKRVEDELLKGRETLAVRFGRIG